MNILKFGSTGPEVKKLQEILKAQGYFKGEPKGNFTELTREAVFWFQATHVGQDGIFLDADCEVGDATWWALNNPSGSKQRTNIDPIIPDGLSEDRIKVLQVAVAEHKKGVKEVPDGSNWGPEIQKYGGQKGWAWCALFMSYCFKQALGKYPAGKIEPSCFRVWKAAESKGIWIPKTKKLPTPGDAFIMQYKDTRGNYTGKGHTGIILRISADGKLFNAIEGNTANAVKCTVREFSNSKIIGFVSPYGDVVKTYERGVLYGDLTADSLNSTR